MNVQGLISRRTNKLLTPELQNVFQNNDVVLFTETWSNNMSDVHVDNFECYVLNREENIQSSKRSSGGLIVYLRNNYVSSETLVFTSEDDILCIKIRGSLLGLDNDLYYCLTYVVPENSSRQGLIESHTLDRLLLKITELEANNSGSFYMILCGDFNAHTSDSADYVIDDHFSHMPDLLPDSYIYDVPIRRCSKDQGRTNNYGIMLLDLCKQTGLRILNGRFDKDKEGNFTHVGSRGSSVVDYVIATQNLFNNISSFEVNAPNILSDHCSIKFSLSFNKSEGVVNGDKKLYVSVDHKYIWDGSKKDTFLENLLNQDCVDRLAVWDDDLQNARSSSDIDVCVRDMSTILQDSAECFKRRCTSKSTNDSNNIVISQNITTQPCLMMSVSRKEGSFIVC